MDSGRFEDLKTWQEARNLAKMVYEAVKADRSFDSDFRFRDQIQSAAVSVMSNIAEGFSRRSNKEFVQFLFVSKGSLAEVQSQLYIALDQHYITQHKFDELYNKADEVAKLISGFITYLMSLNKNKSQRIKQPQGTLETQQAAKLEKL